MLTHLLSLYSLFYPIYKSSFKFPSLQYFKDLRIKFGKFNLFYKIWNAFSIQKTITTDMSKCSYPQESSYMIPQVGFSLLDTRKGFWG